MRGRGRGPCGSLGESPVGKLGGRPQGRRGRRVCGARARQARGTCRSCCWSFRPRGSPCRGEALLDVAGEAVLSGGLNMEGASPPMEDPLEKGSWEVDIQGPLDPGSSSAKVPLPPWMLLCVAPTGLIPPIAACLFTRPLGRRRETAWTGPGPSPVPDLPALSPLP